MLRAGLRESRGWDDQEVASYLASVLPRTSPVEG